MSDREPDAWQLTGTVGWPDGLYPVSGNARLVVGAPAGRRVRATGVGRFFRKDEVHIENSVGVVAGDRCRLLAEDHFHVYRATIDFGVLDDPPRRLREALEALVAAPDDRDALAEFATELRRVSGAVTPPGPDVEERRIAPHCSVSIADSVGVQLGDGTQLNIHHEYIVEQIEIPLIELLTNENVLRQFAHALAAPDDPEAMTEFLRTMTEALELVDDEVLTALSEPRAGSDTLLHSLFGRAEITCAEPVMIGVDNELERTTEYRLPRLRHRDVDTALAAVFDDIAIPELAEPEESVKEPDELLEEESAPIKREPDEPESPEKLAESEPVKEPEPVERELDESLEKEPDPFDLW